MAKSPKSKVARSTVKRAAAAPVTARAADKKQHTHGSRRSAPALRQSDWPTNDLLEASPSTASRKRQRTSEARADRPLH